MKFTPTKSEGYVVVPEGIQVLTIISAKAVPSGRPQFIEVEFKHANGGVVKSKYDLTKEIGAAIFSILLRCTIGDVEEFDTDDIGTLIGKTIKAEIVHNKVESTKEAGKILTFVNIKKIMNNDSVAVEENIEEEEI